MKSSVFSVPDMLINSLTLWFYSFPFKTNYEIEVETNYSLSEYSLGT